MAKFRKDVKVELAGVAAAAIAGQVVTLVIESLNSASVDWQPTYEAILKMSPQE